MEIKGKFFIAKKMIFFFVVIVLNILIMKGFAHYVMNQCVIFALIQINIIIVNVVSKKGLII